MIVTKSRKELVAIHQQDHADFAAFLLEHWNDHNLKHDPLREQIISATRLHDNGWQEFDASIRLDEKTKLPVDFRKITPEEIYEIWMRGSQRYIEDDPYVALLITHHAYALHEHAHNRSGIWKEFFVTLAQQRGKIRDALGMTHNDIEHGYSFLRMADWLSLMYCTTPTLGSGRPAQYAGYKVVRDEDNLRIRPFPYTEHLTYQLPIYPLERKGYGSEKEMKDDLKKPQQRTIRIEPLEL